MNEVYFGTKPMLASSRPFPTFSFTIDVVNVPRGTAIGRYLCIIAAFASSGVMHLIIDLSSGISVRDSGAVVTFTVQALGLIVEGIVIGTYQTLTQRGRLGRKLEMGVGFIWVAMFLTWSIPAYVYPMMWRSQLGLNDSTIPFTLFGKNAEYGKAVGSLFGLGLIAIVGIFKGSSME
jgi:hypothetical protein